MRSPAFIFVALLVACHASSAVEIGVIDQKDPPAKKELVAPKSGDGIEKVNLRAAITGKTSKDEKRKVYIVVNPLSNPNTQNVWWVQENVQRVGDKFECSCQFGNDNEGSGEYFAIIAVATDMELTAGDKLEGIPEKMTYTKLKIVKRN